MIITNDTRPLIALTRDTFAMPRAQRSTILRAAAWVGFLLLCELAFQAKQTAVLSIGSLHLPSLAIDALTSLGAVLLGASPLVIAEFVCPRHGPCFMTRFSGKVSGAGDRL